MYIHATLRIDGETIILTYDGEIMIIENTTNDWEVRGKVAPTVQATTTQLFDWQRGGVPLSKNAVKVITSHVAVRLERQGQP